MTVDIPSLVQVAGGEIVGKVRAQKMIYLLDQIGLGSGYPFEYRHYGPYSEELAEQMEDDVIFGRLETVTKRRQSDGVPYTVYKVTELIGQEGLGSPLPIKGISWAIEPMQRQSSTVLELAATIHWLSEVEGYNDWRAELVRRKGAKTEADNTEKALELLRLLELPPAA